MAEDLLVDTDVLIDFLRGGIESLNYLESLTEPPSVSAITIAELYAGVREGNERDLLDSLAQKLRVIDVSKEIALLGGLLRRNYFKSHGTGINDAIIATTAKSENCILVTLNRKHFPMIENLTVPYRKF